MRNFHVKSIILGIGIGIVITSIISMIYAAGINNNRSISREEIIAKAKELGMVDGTPFLSTQQKGTENNTESINEVKNENSEDKKESTKNQDTTKSEELDSSNHEVKPIEKVIEAAEVTVSVKHGDTSETVASKLLQSGLIADKKGFIGKLTEMKLSEEINIGEFKIKKDASDIEIIRIITGRK